MEPELKAEPHILLLGNPTKNEESVTGSRNDSDDDVHFFFLFFHSAFYLSFNNKEQDFSIQREKEGLGVNFLS
jgi:hypothetical protein